MSTIEVESFIDAWLPLGRNAGPRLLLDWVVEGRLDDPRVLGEVITEVWTSAEFPERVLGSRLWVSWFRHAGFLTDVPGGELPREPLTMHRGATWGRRRGMAWTLDLEKARWFAARTFLFGEMQGMLYTTTIAPTYVLAFFNGPESRREAEIVVDPAGLPPIRKGPVVALHEES